MKSQFPNNKDILVVGSKKGLKIPTSKIYKAYLANGAISFANKLKKTKGFELSCVTGAAIYLRHKEIRKKILDQDYSNLSDILIKNFISNLKI